MKSALLALAAAIFALAFGVPEVYAQSYPARVLTLVVPFPAGSTTDNVARKMADYIRAKTNATVIVDNKVGADGNIAAQYVLSKPADGYTVFITGNSVHGANANVYREMPFNPINDFDMIGGVMIIPMILTVKPDFPASNVKEFVAEAKKRTTPFFFASGNTSTRGAAELFKARYGFNAEHVPYKGSPQVIVDLLGGQFDWAFVDANTIAPFLRDGRLKGLAITSEARLPNLPNIPTVAESLPGFQFGAWVGVVVRSKTPLDIETKLATLVHDFTVDPATVVYLTSIGSAPMPMNPQRLKSFVESETKTWAEIVKIANIEKK